MRSAGSAPGAGIRSANSSRSAKTQFRAGARTCVRTTGGAAASAVTACTMRSAGSAEAAGFHPATTGTTAPGEAASMPIRTVSPAVDASGADAAGTTLSRGCGWTAAAGCSGNALKLPSPAGSAPISSCGTRSLALACDNSAPKRGACVPRVWTRNTAVVAGAACEAWSGRGWNGRSRREGASGSVSPAPTGSGLLAAGRQARAPGRNVEPRTGWGLIRQGSTSRGNSVLGS